ncbi:MAG: peptidoglycan-binding protein [Bacteroides sp.]
MASSYGHIKKGATGDTVSWIQQQLGINADGKFGSQTEQAVRDFQRTNGIQVDGIVGNETMEYLLGKGSSNNNTVNTDWLANYGGNRPTYSPSQAVNDAASMLSQYEGNRPGDYQSKYGDQIQAMLDKILNREDFSYDFNADPMYQQYADRYQQQGQMAMMDTMGNAAALSGGYGNSYAQTVGQQTYQGYLQELNDVIPELRNASYQMYQDEGDKMLTDVSLLQGLDESDYGRYRDDVGDYYTDLNYYYNKYNDMSESEYNRYRDDVSAWENDRAYWYTKQQDEQSQSNWEKEYALAAQSAKRSGGSSGGSRSGSTTESYATVKAYLDDVFAGGATSQELLASLYGVSNISDDDFDKLKSYITILAASGGGNTGNTSNTGNTIPNYDVLAPFEFEKDAALKKKYRTYPRYLEAMKNGK